MDKVAVEREYDFDSMEKIIGSLKGEDMEKKVLCLKALDTLCEDRIYFRIICS